MDWRMEIKEGGKKVGIQRRREERRGKKGGREGREDE